MGETGDPAPSGAVRERPETEASYGIPSDRVWLLPWDFVRERMRAASGYWVTTTRPDGHPHARPVWGVWLDDTVYCGGGEQTRWVRNLARNDAIAVHLERTDSVVIVEGRADRLTDASADAALLERIDDAYEAKYGVRHGTPVFAVRPTVVLAWADYPRDATRWVFDD